MKGHKSTDRSFAAFLRHRAAGTKACHRSGGFTGFQSRFSRGTGIDET